MATEDAFLSFLDEIPITSLRDDQVMDIANLQAPPEDQKRLSELLVLNREDELTDEEQAEFDELMRRYNLGLLLKSQGLKEAVQRGLMPPLNWPPRKD